MKVEKVINNNIVRSSDNNGKEVLVMGCGLGFKKSIGDIIDETKIEKIYIMSDSSGRDKLEKILSKVDLQTIQITNDIVAYAKKMLNHDLSDNIYLTLCDHICFALERNSEDIQIKNALLNEIKRFYDKEYQVGLEALKIIEKHVHIQLPVDEAGFIALHVVNASFDASGIQQTREMMQVIQHILNIIKYHFNLDINEESLYYERFLTHLKFFVKRLFLNECYQGDNDESFFLLMKNQYQKEYICVLKIDDYIQKQFSTQLSHDDMLFLMIHIRKIMTTK